MAKGTVNKVILVGRLGQRPECLLKQGGVSVANFNIATNESRKVGDNWEDSVDWHRVVCFGKTAENAEKYLDKGSQVYIEGRLRTRSWKKEDGSKGYITEVVVRVIEYLSKNKQNSLPPSDDPGYIPSEEDDLPF